jgi:hypothetical protein
MQIMNRKKEEEGHHATLHTGPMPGTSRRKKRNKINSKLSEHQTILNPLLPKKTLPSS